MKPSLKAMIKSDRGSLAAGLSLAVLVVGCMTLTPIRAAYHMDLEPIADGRSYQIDQVDNGAVFAKEGLRLKVRHLSDRELNALYPDSSNPFTYRGEVDPKLGHVPLRFTVFQVVLNNPTFDKVLLQPEDVFLRTDRGKIMRPYQLTRAEARGDERNFETYWLSRGVQSGNKQKLYLERMGILRGALYHRDAPVFKGRSYRGLLVFDPLAPDAREVNLHLDDLVLEFGIYDTPKDRVDLEFSFLVHGEIVEPEPAMAGVD